MKALLLPVALAWSGMSVLHLGDSHVASGLTAGLRERLRARGARYHSDYWVSASTARWAYSSRLTELMWRWRPDAVIVTLGSNEAHYPNAARYASHMQRLIARFRDRPCYWIGPPRYEHIRVDRMVEWQSANAGRCAYFDSRGIEAPRGHTRLHFTREGGLVWADAVWKWMNGEAEPPPPGDPAASISAVSPLRRRNLQ